MKPPTFWKILLPPGRVLRLGVCLWGLFSEAAFSQSYRFTQINIANPNVASLFQDRYGFVWMGTEGGLYRFDGYDFVLYEHKPGDSTSLPSNSITYHAFHQDDNGDLWVATSDAGFARFNRRTERFERFQAKPGDTTGLTFNAVTALCGDGDQGLWIATKRGLNHFSPADGRFTRFLAPEPGPDILMGTNLLLDLCLAGDKRLWIGTGQGVAVRDADGRFHRFFPRPDRPGGLSADYVTDVFEDKKHQIWIATQNGLNRWVERDSFVRYFPGDQVAGDFSQKKGYNYILRVWEDRDGVFWLGTNAGLLRFNPERETFERVAHDQFDPYSIGKGAIYDILEDRTGRLWFAHREGVSIWDNKTAVFQDKGWNSFYDALQTESAFGRGVMCMAQTGRRFWLSTQKELFAFSPGEGLRRVLTGNFDALFADSRGRLWAGTVQPECYILDPETFRVLETISKTPQGQSRNHNQPVGLRNSAFAEDRNGFFWIGTYMTLNRYDPAKNQYRQFYPTAADPRSLSNSTIHDLHYDRRGTLWIATNGGLNALSAETLRRPIEDTLLPFRRYLHDPRDANSISNNRVRCILEDRRGGMWFGTDVGLNLLLPDGRWQRFFREDGLPDNAVTGLLEDDAGYVWASTANGGLACLDPQTGKILCFNARDGLYTDRFLNGACLKTDAGLLVFAGYGGLNGFDPRAVAPRRDTLTLQFVALKINNRPVHPGDENGLLQQPLYLTNSLTLDFDSKVVTLQVAALNAPNPERQVYRYRLDGFWASQGWIDLGTRREITFTNLFPGKYTLRVESTAHPDGREQWESAATLSIRVKFPWVQFLAIIGMLAAVFYTIYKLRLNRKLAATEARRLAELDAVKTRLYTNITHEFRTPLTVILGEAAQLEKQVEETQKGGLAAIRRQGRQLLNLVNQMLDLAKVEAGSLPVQLTQGNVVLFLKYLLESFQSLAESKGIALHFETDADEFWIDYDPDKLQKIAANLLSNAIKFTPSGGQVRMKLEIKKLGAVRNFPISQFPNFQFLLHVADTGTGIAPESLPFVFDRFYQADDSSTRPGEGTGIGLNLTREMIQLLGGSIRVESRPGAGAVFTVELPVSRDAARTTGTPADFVAEETPPELVKPLPALPESRSPAPDARPRLLLIEDNPDVVRYLSALLAADYQLYRAATGRAGLELALELTPDLVLSDVMMPEMDGFAVCRALKTDARTSHIPVVLLTAKADMDSRIEGLEHGADAYLAKPFEERELRVVLRKLFELRQALQAHYRAPEFWNVPTPPGRPLDDEFLQKIKAFIEVDLMRSWTVDDLTGVLFVSRSQLHRKLEALTGMHTTEFVRYVRLLNAARWLTEQPGKKIADIAYDVGFGSPNEFSNRFREVFGCSPREWRERGGA